MLFGLMGDDNMVYISEYISAQHGRYISPVADGASVSMAVGYGRIKGTSAWPR
jgi:hypothetical protein